ncbi:MAG TPA: NAD-binding protein, partial [Tenuifilaceae bacterium]|nr:NAD-binding protein [Tenuifilaceae bacterium]
MRIIIAGAGEVGSHLARMLSYEYHGIIVIDPDSEKLVQLASNIDVLTVEGSAASFAALKEANVNKADLFVAVTHFEEANIISATLAKRLGAKKVISRIDNNEYMLPSNKDIFLNLGIDSLIYPEKLAAREVIGILGQTGSAEFVDFSGGKLSLAVIKLDEDAPVIDQSLVQVTKRNERL